MHSAKCDPVITFATWLGVVVCTSCSATPPSETPPNETAQPKPTAHSPESPDFAKGVSEAQAEIRRGHVTLYTMGYRDFEKSYDAETGLPLEGIAGCIVEDSVIQRAQGHNEYVRQWIAEGNTPPNSLKQHNRLIAKPFTEIQISGLVNLLPNTPTHLNGALTAHYRILSKLDDIDHKITVSSPSGTWSHFVFIHDAKNFKAGLVADGRILALRYVADGKESFAGRLYETIHLFDSATGISLNVVYREIDKPSD